MQRKSWLIKWERYDQLLGTMTDRQLSKVIGCTDTGVRNRRELLSVAPKNKRTTRTKEIKEEVLRLLKKNARKCNKCNLIKSIKEYSKSKLSPEGISTWCRPCKANYSAKRIEEKRRYWVNLAGKKCHNCSWKKYPLCLDFHHVNGKEKKWVPGKLIASRPTGSKEVFDELNKCVLLCCNCHQAIHRGAITLSFIKNEGLGWTLKK